MSIASVVQKARGMSVWQRLAFVTKRGVSMSAATATSAPLFPIVRDPNLYVISRMPMAIRMEGSRAAKSFFP